MRLKFLKQFEKKKKGDRPKELWPITGPATRQYFFLCLACLISHLAVLFQCSAGGYLGDVCQTLYFLRLAAFALLVCRIIQRSISLEIKQFHSIGFNGGHRSECGVILCADTAGRFRACNRFLVSRCPVEGLGPDAIEYIHPTRKLSKKLA